MRQNVEPRTEEWHKMRSSRIGSSDAGIIMGVSPWMTPYELWEIKLGLRMPVVSYAMRRGMDMEEEAREKYIEMTGIHVEEGIIIHEEYEWMMASLDGITLDESHAVEIKCPGVTDHDAARKGIVPDKYFWQLQHQMEVCSLASIHYFSYKDGEGIILNVERDDQAIEEMLRKELSFLECLENAVPPDGSNLEIGREDDLWRATAERWIDAKMKLEECVTREKLIRQQLIALADEKPTRGFGVKLSFTKSTTWDWEAIETALGGDASRYRKEGKGFWRVMRDS